MREPGLISALDAHELLNSDPAAVLVCAYEKEEDFRRNDLEGAISLDEFRRRKDSFPKDENVIFYCAFLTTRAPRSRQENTTSKALSTQRSSKAASMPGESAGYALLGAIA